MLHNSHPAYKLFSYNDLRHVRVFQTLVRVCAFSIIPTQPHSLHCNSRRMRITVTLLNPVSFFNLDMDKLQSTPGKSDAVKLRLPVLCGL